MDDRLYVCEQCPQHLLVSERAAATHEQVYHDGNQTCWIEEDWEHLCPNIYGGPPCPIHGDGSDDEQLRPAWMERDQSRESADD